MKSQKEKSETAGKVSALMNQTLLTDIRSLIFSARHQVAQAAQAVNAGLTMLYWEIGRRIRQDILEEKRAAYGKEIVAALGRQLEAEFGRGFGDKNLHRMVQFAEIFPDEKIVAAVQRQLGWTHFKSLIPIEDPLKREFYTEMCRIEGWGTRILDKKIQSMLFESTALSRKSEKLAEMELKALRDENKLTPGLVFNVAFLKA